MADEVSHEDDRIEDERTCAVRRLPGEPTAPGEAREWAAKVLARWGLPDLTDDVQTVLTELVTNSLQAGAGEIGALIEWHRAADLVEVRVWDDAPGEPRLREPDFVAERGRGLFLVDALATAWGHHAGPAGGKVVWARLACPSTDQG